jgi:hypothetical protein
MIFRHRSRINLLEFRRGGDTVLDVCESGRGQVDCGVGRRVGGGTR